MQDRNGLQHLSLKPVKNKNHNHSSTVFSKHTVCSHLRNFYELFKQLFFSQKSKKKNLFSSVNRNCKTLQNAQNHLSNKSVTWI